MIKSIHFPDFLSDTISFRRSEEGREMSGINLALSIAKRAAQAWRRRGLERYLAEADEHLLADIGVSRAQALFELERDPPPLAAAPSGISHRPSPVPQNPAT
jgi:uncharacterized protein YjiS (DUF1127 family)